MIQTIRVPSGNFFALLLRTLLLFEPGDCDVPAVLILLGCIRMQGQGQGGEGS